MKWINKDQKNSLGGVSLHLRMQGYHLLRIDRFGGADHVTGTLYVCLSFSRLAWISDRTLHLLAPSNCRLTKFLQPENPTQRAISFLVILRIDSH